MSDLNVPAPFSKDGDNQYRVRFFTGPTDHAANVIPKAWHGKYVVIYPIGTDGDYLHFAFAIDDADAEVDSSVAATAAGASAKAGWPIEANTEIQRRVPHARQDQDVYFVRESDGSAFTNVVVALAE